MPLKTVSILSANLSGNALSRAYTLAKLLQPEFRVQVVGYALDDQIWEPVQHDTSIEYRRFYYPNQIGFFLNARCLSRRLIEGDLILAVKPLNTSFGLGLAARRALGRPLLLDIDDWELGFLYDSVYWECRAHAARWFMSSTSPLYTRYLEYKIPTSDAITVSSSFLQQRYGGVWIGQPRDETIFDPAQYHNDVDVQEVHAANTVLFLGSAREHKGLAELVDAWRTLNRKDALLRIVGTPLDAPIIRKLQDHNEKNVRFDGVVPFSAVPRILASASVVVIPQRADRASVGQLPMKLIDAMALGRPIISTSVSDIPKWLSEGAGWVVPPGDVRLLCEGISTLLDRPECAAKMGYKARQRFLRYGSFSVVRPRLFGLVKQLLTGEKVTNSACPKFLAE